MKKHIDDKNQTDINRIMFRTFTSEGSLLIIDHNSLQSLNKIPKIEK